MTDPKLIIMKNIYVWFIQILKTESFFSDLDLIKVFVFHPSIQMFDAM